MTDLALQLVWRLTLALVLILILRWPVRRVFGAVASYVLWTLVPVLLATLWLPSWGGSALPALRMPTLGGTLVQAGLAPATDGHGFVWGDLLWVLWIGGCLYGLARMAHQYRQTAHQRRTMSETDRALWDARLQRLGAAPVPALAWHPHGPALLGPLRPRLLLPRDFGQRHSATQQDLILRHELAHRAHGDGCWNLLAELLAAAFWFHPLLPFAMRRFRQDQETACDCAVLLRQPAAAADYGHALLNTHSGGAVGIAAHWLHKPTLKERMMMLKSHSMSPARRRLGLACVLALVVGTAWAAQDPGVESSIGTAQMTKPAAAASADAAAHTTPPSKNISLSAGIKPHYPPEAIKNKEQGKVIVLVQVGKDGRAQKVRLDGDQPVYPSLAQAAMDWARKLHYNPGMRNGKPYVGWARIPVTFSLHPLNDKSDSKKDSTSK